jgi:hypothetical protein
MTEQNMKKADFVTSIFWVLFGGYIVFEALSMPTYAQRGQGAFSAPGIVPGFLGSVIALLGLAMLLRAIVQKDFRLGLTVDKLKVFFSTGSTRRISLTILICALYGMGFIGRMPYWLATALFIVIFIVAFDWDFKKTFLEQRGEAIKIILIAGLTSALVTVVFQNLFLVNLP